jgi:hypothetical protein
MFRKHLLTQYQTISAPGTYKVKVAADVTDDNLYLKDDYPRYLIPLRVIKADKLIELMGLLNKYKEIPFSIIKKFFMTGAIFLDDDLDLELLPIKGEEVIATFDYDDKSKLVVKHISLVPREELDYIDLAAIDDFYNLIKNHEDE